MRERPPYRELREFFANEDTDFCDLAAPDAKREAWARFLKEVVPRWPHRFTLSRSDEEGKPQAIPDDPIEALLLANSDDGPWPALRLELAGLEVLVHFFDPDWLGLDFWRREVTEESYAAIVELMRQMGDVMGHDIFLTPEQQEIEGELVYEATARRFRRPRRGAGPDTAVRVKVLAEINDALQPLLRFSQELEQRGGRHEGPLPDDLVPPVLQRVEQILSNYPELALQDALSMNERAWVRKLWSGLATVAQRKDTPIYWQCLLKAVRERP